MGTRLIVVLAGIAAVVLLGGVLGGCGASASATGPQTRLADTRTVETVDPATGASVKRTITREAEASAGTVESSGDTAAAKSDLGVPSVSLGDLGAGPSAGAARSTSDARASTSEARRWLLLLAGIGTALYAGWSLYLSRLPCAINWAIGSAALWTCYLWPSIGDLVIVGAVVYGGIHGHWTGGLLNKTKGALAAWKRNTAKIANAVSNLAPETKAEVKDALRTAAVDDAIIAEAKAVKP